MSTSDKAMNPATLELTQKIQLHFPRNISDDMLKAWNGCKVDILTTRLNEILSHPPEIKISAEKFVLLKEFYLKVPWDYDPDKQLEIFAMKYKENFCGFNDKITDKNFSRVSHRLIPGKTYKIMKWVYEKTYKGAASFYECLAWLENNNVLFTGAQGLSLLYQEKKGELFVDQLVFSLDRETNLLQSDNNWSEVPIIGRPSSGACYMFDLRSLRQYSHHAICLVGFCAY